MGLLGDGGVHALDRHLFALLALAERCGAPRVAVHALLDGRDTLPKSAHRYMRETMAEATRRGARIASLGGRYFGMDRDRRWERVRLWYDAAVLGVGPQVDDPVAAIGRRTSAGRRTSSSRPWSSATAACPSHRCATATP